MESHLAEVATCIFLYTPKNFFPSGIYNSKDAYDVISEFPQISSDVGKLKDLLPDEFLKNIINKEFKMALGR